MAKKVLTSEQKRLDADLWTIVIASFVVMGIYIAFQSHINSITRDSEQNILLRVLLGAAFQFGLAGLGITIVSIIRKESFLSYGLRIKGAVPSLYYAHSASFPT